MIDPGFLDVKGNPANKINAHEKLSPSSLVRFVSYNHFYFFVLL
jgi:hypothetical protein